MQKFEKKSVAKRLKSHVWGPSETLVKEEGSLDLVSDYGGQRARFKAQVRRDRKGSNPTINLISSTAAVVARTRLSVTLYILCLSC